MWDVHTDVVYPHQRAKQSARAAPALCYQSMSAYRQFIRHRQRAKANTESKDKHFAPFVQAGSVHEQKKKRSAEEATAAAVAANGMDAAAEPAEELPKKKKKKAKVENGEAAGAAVAALAAAPALNGDAGDAVVKKKKKKAAEDGETPVGKKAKAADGEKVCDESVHVCLHKLTLCVSLWMLCCAGFQQVPVLQHARLSCHCICTELPRCSKHAVTWARR